MATQQKAQAQQTANGPREKILRIGVILGGKIVEERLIRTRETVTIGQSAKNTFAIPAPELPRTWQLFKLVGTKYVLNVNESMDGRLSDGGNVMALAQLKAGGQAQKQAQGWALPLSDNARGKIILGDMTLLFQFVVAPPLQPRPQLPHSVRGTLADRIDPYMAIILVLSFMVHGGVGLWVYRMDVEKPIEPDKIPDKYAKALLAAPPAPKPEPEVKGKDENKDKDKKEPDKKPEPSKPAPPKHVETAEEAAKRKSAEEAALKEKQAKDKAAAAGVLIAVAGAKSDGSNPSSFQDVSNGKRPPGSAGDALKGAQQEGKDIALNGSGKDGSRHTPGGDVGNKNTGGNGVNNTDPGDGGKKEELVAHTDVKKPTVIDPGTGDLSPEDVFQKIRSRYQHDLTLCYQNELKQDSGLHGAVNLTITIGTSGRVSAADVDGPMSAVNACVKQKAKNWTFDNPKKATATFAFTFSFSSSKH